jgi:hypothetical protein
MPYPHPCSPHPHVHPPAIHLVVECLQILRMSSSKPTVTPWVSSGFSSGIMYYNLYTYETCLLVLNKGHNPLCLLLG